jgi:hypothetical protein
VSITLSGDGDVFTEPMDGVISQSTSGDFSKAPRYLRLAETELSAFCCPRCAQALAPEAIMPSQPRVRWWTCPDSHRERLQSGSVTQKHA